MSPVRPHQSHLLGHGSRKEKRMRKVDTFAPHNDGHQWRKYGEKKINSCNFPRYYYRCTYKDNMNCPATKQIQQKDHSDPPLYQVTYYNEHSCNSAFLALTPTEFQLQTASGKTVSICFDSSGAQEPGGGSPSSSTAPRGTPSESKNQTTLKLRSEALSWGPGVVEQKPDLQSCSTECGGGRRRRRRQTEATGNLAAEATVTEVADGELGGGGDGELAGGGDGGIRADGGDGARRAGGGDGGRREEATRETPPPAPRLLRSPASECAAPPNRLSEMGYDAMANGAPSPAVAREAKKKRGNRSAKLKQSKLDVRREQWLSQVKDVKEVKAVASPAAAGASSGSPILASPHPPLPRRRVETLTRGEEPEDNKDEADVANQEAGSSDVDSPVHSHVSYNSPGCSSQRKHCRIYSPSSGSSAWSSSRSVSDAEDEGTGGGDKDDDDDVLDDWEAVADALVDSNYNHQALGTEEPPVAPVPCVEPAHAAKRPEPIKSQRRAWSPDDDTRPHTLPSLSKQASFPASMGNCWVGMGIGVAQKGILSFEMSCPICYEDLDPTDSRFLPCPCGFHLCLFCHKRILEADARCPGCRKLYKSAALDGEAGNGREPENLVQMRLSRSCSMGPRY